MVYLIVGLGNPGSEYERTRHNLGFMVIDKLAGDEGFPVGSRECRSLVGRGQLEGKPVKLIKPQTFMNMSGEAVSCFSTKHHLVMPAETLVVLSDDLALPIGKIRIRERGTAGGHNGLKSIIEALRTNDFIRVRMGILPDHPISDTKGFVLSRFASGERELVEQMVEQAAKAVRTIVRDGALKAMREFN
jgi:PTH1 family peptidyl-tRNA hydrolase